MPLDQAVYVPAPINRIFGVRAGYVHEFNPSTGALLQTYRFASPAFPDASIAWDTVNSKIFCSVWNVRSFAAQSLDYDRVFSRRLYRITPNLAPLNMIVEASAEIKGEPAVPGYVGTEADSWGPHRMLFYNGVIYLPSRDNSGGSKMLGINPLTLATSINGVGVNWQNGTWIDMAIETDGANPHIWYNDPYDNVTNYYTSDLTSYDYDDFPAPGPPYDIVYGICFCPSNGKMYGTCRKPKVLRWTPTPTPGSTPPPVVINTGDATATPYRIAYNAYDGLIYVPGLASNNVVVIDPASDTVVSTQTLFDSPFDMCFTPTKKWAVQQGAVGLKEVL